MAPDMSVGFTDWGQGGRGLATLISGTRSHEDSHQLHWVQLGLEVLGGQVVPAEKQIHQRWGGKGETR